MGGYVINVAKGKAKFPPDFSKMFAPPGGAAANPFGAGAGAGANPFGAGGNPFGGGAGTDSLADIFGAAQSAPPAPTTQMPMSTPASKPPPPRNAPPVIDA